MKNRLALVGGLIIGLLIISAVLSPLISPYPPRAIDLAGELERPGPKHLLGQDKLGRDILSRLIYGSRVSLLVGFSVVGISLILGVLIGAFAGYFGGFWDILAMRLIDILLSFPGILLAIAITGILGPSLEHIILSLCILSWVGYARIVRGQILTLREREYVVAAKALGVKSPRIILKHILPNLWGPVIVEATFGVAGAILAESSLSFLGLGPQGIPTWGAMLNEGADYLLFAPHVATFPGMAIMLTVLGFNFLGDGLRDRLDPKLRG